MKEINGTYYILKQKGLYANLGEVWEFKLLTITHLWNFPTERVIQYAMYTRMFNT